MFFFILRNIEINFIGCYIYRRTSPITKVFLTTKQIKFIRNKDFTVVTLDPENEILVIDIAFIKQNSDIHDFLRTQIALLKANETFTLILSKYIDYVNVFSKN